MNRSKPSKRRPLPDLAGIPLSIWESGWGETSPNPTWRMEPLNLTNVGTSFPSPLRRGVGVRWNRFVVPPEVQGEGNFLRHRVRFTLTEFLKPAPGEN